MSTVDINTLSERFPNLPEKEAAQAYAKEKGYVLIFKYRRKGADQYSHYGLCRTFGEIESYYNSPDVEEIKILYDGRITKIFITADYILLNTCYLCKRKTTKETFVLRTGNDFYFCPKCGLMFCDSCCDYLPLTNVYYGYRICINCGTRLKRAYPGQFGI
jgi:uncharacterized C2H2 Zn-finger protein